MYCNVKSFNTIKKLRQDNNWINSVLDNIIESVDINEIFDLIKDIKPNDSL